jgi:hypothetical protein
MENVLPYVLALAKKHTNEIGFIPRPKLELYEQRGQILAAQENDELCGFLVLGRDYRTMHVYQTCVQYDARRRKHAIALVNRLEQIAARRNCTAISLRCALDLEANSFWLASGFKLERVDTTPNTRGRQVGVYRKEVTPCSQRLLFVPG